MPNDGAGIPMGGTHCAYAAGADAPDSASTASVALSVGRVTAARLCNQNAAGRSNRINWLITGSLPRFVKRASPHAGVSRPLDRVSELAMLYSGALAGAKRESRQQHSGRTYAVRLTSFASKTFIARASDFRSADRRRPSVCAYDSVV